MSHDRVLGHPYHHLRAAAPGLLAVPCHMAGGPLYAKDANSRRGLHAGTVLADAAFPQLLPLYPSQKGLPALSVFGKVA